MSQSHPDVLGLDDADDTDSDPPTGVHDMRDLKDARMLFLHQGQKIKQADKRAARHDRAIRSVHGVAVEALSGTQRIETKIDTAIATMKLIAMVAAGVFTVGSGIVGAIGYALAHFTLH